MLVLSRKQQQRVLVGDSIVITLVKVAGGKVRLGIEAPPEVKVVREELLARPDRPARQAASVSTD